MSHSVAILTECKNIDITIQTFLQLGWAIIENAKATTYPSDPSRHTVYPFVAKNPKINGYDVGIQIGNNGICSFHYDPFDRSVEHQLGKSLNKIKQSYAVNLAKSLYDEVEIVETLEDGTIILECEDGL